MILLIDHREKKLIECLRDKVKEFIKTNLDLGDIQIKKSRDSLPILYIERKTRQDWWASICDGRYKEQKSRLLSVRQSQKCSILYILETYKKTRHDKTIDQSVWLTRLRDQIPVLETGSVSETVTLIIKIFQDSNKFIKNETFNYTETLHVCKKKNLTPRRCFIMQLKQFPGISEKTAQAIIQKYPSWVELINHLSFNGPSTLAALTVSKRKIGKKKALEIYQYLFG